MNDNQIKELDYAYAVSERTNPSPNEDSRFFRKNKPDLPLSNPTTTYRKCKGKLLSC